MTTSKKTKSSQQVSWVNIEQIKCLNCIERRQLRSLQAIVVDRGVEVQCQDSSRARCVPWVSKVEFHKPKIVHLHFHFKGLK